MVRRHLAQCTVTDLTRDSRMDGGKARTRPSSGYIFSALQHEKYLVCFLVLRGRVEPRNSEPADLPLHCLIELPIQERTRAQGRREGQVHRVPISERPLTVPGMPLQSPMKATDQAILTWRPASSLAVNPALRLRSRTHSLRCEPF